MASSPRSIGTHRPLRSPVPRELARSGEPRDGMSVVRQVGRASVHDATLADGAQGRSAPRQSPQDSAAGYPPGPLRCWP